MKKIHKIFSSFRVKVTLILMVSLLFVMTLSNFLIYRFSLNSQFNQVRNELRTLARMSIIMVDAEALSHVPLNKDGVNSAAYKTIAEKLNKIKQANPFIKYIYTLKKTDKTNLLQFIVDPEPVTLSNRKKFPTSYPGDIYNAESSPEMLKAFLEPTADKKLTLDRWGVFLSGYAPIINKDGQPIAILGIDMSAQDLRDTQKEINHRSIFVLFIGIFISIILGLLISRKITDPVKKLLEGTRRVGLDDLKHKVEVKDSGEIGELADSFNKMAANLLESRKKLQDYFYHVTQSLVRILEAKDSYTRGHSDRVAEYTKKIALKMNLPSEKIELLKKAAQLHDIGKLGIHEDILNKQEKLSDEEWTIIRMHPLIGEDILKSVSVDEELLTIVRSHHERFDGKGYPDGISGNHVSIDIQIISIADAYDAMTSARAYRQAMSKESAIKELEKNCGAQFNPVVVEAFFKVLAEPG